MWQWHKLVPVEQEEMWQERLGNIPGCVISAGFRISRSAAADFIIAGKATLNGLTCEKPDKAVENDAVISVRTRGKIKLINIGQPTKKGRIPVIIHRYL